MLKTIKVKKQLRLDELIKHVWDKEGIFDGKTHLKFKSDSGFTVVFDHNGAFESLYSHDSEDVFTVEVEKQITEGTIFPEVAILLDDESIRRSWNSSLNDSKKAYPRAVQIFAFINGKLELIWERDN